ncbi:MAG: hypothetical protein JXR10_02170 [Cyclobacteriaceae bacterium]
MKCLTEFVLCLLTLVLYSCSPSTQNQAVSLGELRFNTTDASEIYFNNVRRSYYDLKELKDQGLNYYYPKYDINTSAFLEPYLVLNWRRDQAYIMLGGSENIEEVILKVNSDSSSIRSLRLITPIDQTQFSIEVYNSLVQRDTLYYLDQKNDWNPLFGDEEVKERFRITCYDFLRLVEMK